MKIGLILIGDELLNGSRQDKHLAKVIQLLQTRGMKLSWVRIVSDNEAQLVATFKETFGSGDMVFSFGGIGATPDDLTRQCAAKAVQQTFIRHPKAVQIIEEVFGKSAYPNRIRMAELAQHARLIPNPINRMPGFSLEHHHFVPGFPSMAWPMVEWVLEKYYQSLFNTTPDVDWRWIIKQQHESELIPMMEKLLQTFPEVSLSSLPSTTNREKIDFGLKGKQASVEKAAVWFEKQMRQANIDITKV